MNFFIYGLTVISLVFTNCLSAKESNDAWDMKKLEQVTSFYKNRYRSVGLYNKIVNNRGNGFEELYGTRNMRTVLHGFFYRGGANNRYHRDNRRNNQNPLPKDGLKNLCQENFGIAIYLYSTRFDSAPKITRCNSLEGDKNTLTYKNLYYSRGPSIYNIMKLIYENLRDNKGPIYSHCWNGWHASGFVAAVVLKQFCSFTDDVAIDYWNRATDGNSDDRRYDRIRKSIRDFRPLDDFTISAGVRSLICPNLTGGK